jgi:hypothetical protein
MPVPLLPEHAELVLDLQSCVDDIYVSSRYQLRIDYTDKPTPPLRPVDADWAAELLKVHATRGKK